MTIREITLGDLPALLALLSQAYPCEISLIQAEAIFMQRQGIVKTFVCVEGEMIIGTASLIVEPKFVRAGRPAGHIEDVVVDKDHRGRGIGKRLIQHCVGQLIGGYKVQLACQPHNAGFYRTCGFYETTHAYMRRDA